jgi:hypothetical protein
VTGQGFRGYGVVQYKGLISIPNDKAEAILERGKSSVDGCWLFEPKKITYLSELYEFEVPMPNKFVNSWQPRALTEISWDKIPAKRYPNVEKCPLQLLGKAIESIADKEARPVSYYTSDLEEILLAPYLEIKKDELCITHLDLVALGIIANNEPLPVIGSSSAKANEKPKLESSVEEPQPNKSIQYANDFDELLAKILKNNRTIKHKEVLRILTNEARTEIDSRVYDARNILLDEVEGNIVWLDHYGTKIEKTYAPKTIGNRLTVVRKLIK